MFPVALAIGAGISALSSIAGGVSANKRRRRPTKYSKTVGDGSTNGINRK